MFKTDRSINYVENPILPIKITPVFHMLFAHHIADGTVVNPQNGCLPYFSYRQYDRFYRLSYLWKLENIFGKINYKRRYFEDSTNINCSAVLSSAFFNYYRLNEFSFLSDIARIPKNILEGDRDSLLAILIAFIIDEGNIDSTLMVINLKNKLLIKDLFYICNILGYKSKVRNRNGVHKDYSQLYILRDGMKRFYLDYLRLNKRYPVIHLGKKGERIKRSLEIYLRPIFKTRGNREQIFNLLKFGPLSVNQIAEKINMTRQGVRFHIHNLLKEDKIMLIDNTILNWRYGVKC